MTLPEAVKQKIEEAAEISLANYQESPEHITDAQEATYRIAFKAGHSLAQEEIQKLKRQIERMANALKEIQRVTGTSTLQYKIADRALSAKDGAE